MTYKQAYDKIIEAYFKDEIRPWQPQFCFCGTICESGGWFGSCRLSHNDFAGYKGRDFVRMEMALLDTLYEGRYYPGHHNIPGYEDALFSGMCAALEVLKEVHRQRGEDVDQIPGLVKRNLRPMAQ